MANWPRSRRLPGWLSIAVVTALLAACQTKRPSVNWYRGNLHAHSMWSDGAMLPEDVVYWYAQHGYQFLGLSEHNILPNFEHWVLVEDVKQHAGPDILQRYNQRYGNSQPSMRVLDGVEQWRLKTTQELRAQFERAEQFLLLSNEEITNEVAKSPVHLTAVNISEPIGPINEGTVASAIGETIARIDTQSRRQTTAAIGVVNHPNFAWAIGADALAQAKAAQFIEIFNGHPFTASRGDVGRRSVVRIWDMSNAERVFERGWPPLFGVASDDAHVQVGASEPSPGRGWIMVRAARLSAQELVAAMKNGDFYASTGVKLARYDYDSKKREIALAVAPAPGVTYVTEFISTRILACPSASASAADRWDGPQVGAIVARSSNLEAHYRLTDDDVWVRATVTASRAPANPIISNYEGDTTQFEQAFTQPVGWRQYLSRPRAFRQDSRAKCNR
jgi:hypothetical protein